MASLGFTVIRFSQARATRQTPGIPDRRYYKGSVVLWWEAKAQKGSQSPWQRAFQAMAEAAGELYLVGTDAVLHDWAVEAGLVVRLPGGFRITSLPSPRSLG